MKGSEVASRTPRLGPSLPAGRADARIPKLFERAGRARYQRGLSSYPLSLLHFSTDLAITL